jgi:hypothetical protein
MKLLLLNKLLSFLICLFLLNSCSSIKLDKENIKDIFSFDDKSQSLSPDNSTQFMCDQNQTFFLRYLEGNNAVWIILNNREFRLEKVLVDDNKYSNGKTVLEFFQDNVKITSNEKSLYEQCKEIPSSKN